MGNSPSSSGQTVDRVGMALEEALSQGFPFLSVPLVHRSDIGPFMFFVFQLSALEMTYGLKLSCSFLWDGFLSCPIL